LHFGHTRAVSGFFLLACQAVTFYPPTRGLRALPVGEWKNSSAGKVDVAPLGRNKMGPRVLPVGLHWPFLSMRLSGPARAGEVCCD